jgi:hypothetical protein
MPWEPRRGSLTLKESLHREGTFILYLMLTRHRNNKGKGKLSRGIKQYKN